jgi:small subunit ribosomal protein S4
MILKAGDTLEVRDRPRSRDAATRCLEAATPQQTPTWVSLDRKSFKAELQSIPTREQIAPVVDEQAIVELYSR